MNLEFQTGEIARDRVALAKVKDFGDDIVFVVVMRSEQHHGLLKLVTGGHERIYLQPDEIIEFSYLDKGETK